MIISHRYRCIFLKTKKTAGTSIEIYLARHCGPDDVLTPLYQPVAGHAPQNHRGTWNPLPDLLERGGLRRAHRIGRALFARRRFTDHMPARVLRRRVAPHLWERYFTFCVERDPWDKVVSNYYWLRGYGQSMTFGDYFARGRHRDCLNHPIYCDLDGTVLVDRILRYECLDAGLAQVFGQLGIPFAGSLGIRAKGEYRPPGTDYRNVLTREQRAIVARDYAREIHLHGYGDGPAAAAGEP